MIHAFNVELVTPSAVNTQVQVQAQAQAQPLNVKARVSPPKRTRNKKHVGYKKYSTNNNSFISCPAAIASIAFLMIASLILLSQMDCFCMHFGLPKQITSAQVSHTAEGSFLDVSGSAQVQFDAAAMEQLKVAAKLGVKLNLSVETSLILPDGGPVSIGADQIREATRVAMNQQRRMPMPATML
jgi:hypothetical protein